MESMRNIHAPPEKPLQPQTFECHKLRMRMYEIVYSYAMRSHFSGFYHPLTLLQTTSATALTAAILFTHTT